MRDVNLLLPALLEGLLERHREIAYAVACDKGRHWGGVRVGYKSE